MNLLFSSGFFVSFGLGFLYFLGAIPAGAAAGIGVWWAAVAAWAGYSAGAAVVLVAGKPVRNWLVAKLRIPVNRDPSKWIWKAWDRWGIVGLGLLAPVTIGPQAGACLALAVGSGPKAIFLSLSLGAVPWCILFSVLVKAGIRFAQ